MIIEVVVDWRLRELDKHKKLKEEGAIEVTDLIRCPLKREFEDKFPDLYKASAYTPATYWDRSSIWVWSRFCRMN